MKLLSLYVESFGKLSDFKYDFKNDMNSLKEENGWGKTTLTIFIKSMLYGLNSKEERERYTPWKNLTSFGGTLVIEYDNKAYRIERSFDPKKPALDTVNIYDVATNKKVKQNGIIGEKILNLNESSFERSVYIPEHELDSGFTSDIENKLKSLIGGTPDEADFDEAIKLLSEREDYLALDNKKGLIAEKKEELLNIDNEIKENNENVRKIPDISQNIIFLDDERAHLINRRKEINAKIVEYGKNQEKLSKLELLDKYDKDILESEKALALNNQIFNGIAVTQDDINEYRFKYKKLESLRVEYEIKKNTPPIVVNEESSKLFNDDNIPTDTDLLSIEKKIDKLKSIKGVIEAHTDAPVTKKPVLGIAFMIVGIVLLLAGLAVVGLSHLQIMNLAIVGYITSGVSLLFIVLSTVFFIVNNAKNTNNVIGGSIKAYDYEQKTLTSEIRDYFSKYHLYTSDFSGNLYLLKSSKEKYAAYKAYKDDITSGKKNIENEIKMLDNDIRHFLGQFSTTAQSVEHRIGELNTHIRNQNDLFSDLMKKRDFRNYFVSENELEDIPELNYDLDKLNQELSEIDYKISTILTNKHDFEKELSSLEGLQIYVDDLYEAKDELNKEIANLENEYRLMHLTRNYLVKSQKSLLERYATPMKESINKYIKILLKNQSEYNIDANFKFSFKTSDGLKNIAEYSKGYQAIISLCMRLALIDCLYPNEKPFIILDDPFATFDDEKLELCKTLIHDISDHYQIIYFTCHKSRLID